MNFGDTAEKDRSAGRSERVSPAQADRIQEVHLGGSKFLPPGRPSNWEAACERISDFTEGRQSTRQWTAEPPHVRRNNRTARLRRLLSRQ